MHSEIRDNVLYLSGDVTVKTLDGNAYSRFVQQCRLKETEAVDFGAVSRADSACVSLLLGALRLKKEGLKLRRIPEPVRALADLYDIKDWANP